MATFTGTAGNDIADAANGVLTGYTTGTLVELQDALGDEFLPDAGANLIVAGDGNDTIVGGFSPGDDAFDAGAGTDTLDYSATTNGVLVDLSALPSQQATGIDIGTDTIAGFEIFIGGSGVDTFIGDAAANTFVGGGDNDQFRGGTGADTMIGDAGDDSFRVFDGDIASGEVLDGGADSDAINFELSNAVDLTAVSFGSIEVLSFLFSNVLDATLHADQFDAGGLSSTLEIAGSDVVSGSVTVLMDTDTDLDLTNVVISGFNGVDLILTGDNDDELIVGSINHFFSRNVIDAGGGADTIAGGNTDVLRGGTGNDRISINSGVGSVEIDGGTEIDTLVISRDQVLDFRFSTLSSIERIEVAGGAVDTTATFLATQIGSGLAANLELSADVTNGSSANVVFDMTGTNSIDLTAFQGSGPLVTVLGTAAGDNIQGWIGADVIHAEGGNDIVASGAGNDTIIDTAGTLVSIDAGSGDDTIRIGNSFTSGMIAGGLDFDTLEIGGGGSVSLVGLGLSGIESIILTDPTGTRLTLASIAQLPLLTDAQGGNDVLVLGTVTLPAPTTLRDLLYTTGFERIEWYEPTYGLSSAVKEGADGFRRLFVDDTGTRPYATISSLYNADAIKIAQSQFLDTGLNNGVLLTHVFDPVTGLATTVTNSDTFNTRTYSVITTQLVDGLITESRTINDNNTPSTGDDTTVDQFFTAGVITLEITTDASPLGNGKPWVTVAREYVGGVTQIFRTTNDNGTQQVVGTAGSQVIEGGATNDVLLGGAGADTFRFSAAGFRSDTIHDFLDGTDLLDLTGLGIDTRAELNAAASVTQSGANTVINFGNGDIVTIRNLQQTSLGDPDFFHL